MTVERVCLIKSRGPAVTVTYDTDRLPSEGRHKLRCLRDGSEWLIKGVEHYAMSYPSWRGRPVAFLLPDETSIVEGDEVEIVWATDA
jgi:hypothetical protein